MRTFEITQEQIKWLSEQKYISSIVKQWFPEAFELELEVGKWYKIPNTKFLICITDLKEGLAYGFNFKGDFKEETFFGFKGITEATPQEVQTALVREAVKRGYQKGVFCEFGTAKDIREIKSNFPVYKEHRNGLYVENDEIFVNGKWSPIVLETITKDEAEKILNKKIV